MSMATNGPETYSSVPVDESFHTDAEAGATLHSGNPLVEIPAEPPVPFDSTKELLCESPDSISGEIDRKEASSNVPPPDVGFAWVMVVISFIVHIIDVGYISSYGVWQQYFTEQSDFFAGTSNIAVSMVGGLAPFTMVLVGIPSGWFADRYGYKLATIVGGAMIAVSYVLASFSTQLWHLCLTQGVLFGIGNSISYFPVISSIGGWFEKRRGLATGIAVAGGGIGGFILSPLVRWMLNTIGWQWTLRVMGLVGGGVVMLCGLIIRQRIATQNKKKFDFSLFTKNVKFILMFCATIWMGLAYQTPFVYLSKYATAIGLSPDTGALLVGLLNAGSGFGRIFVGWVADAGVGHLNTLAMTVGTASILVLVFWPFATSFVSVAIFAVLLGVAIGGLTSLLPAAIAHAFGTANLSTITGMVYTGYGPGNLIGGPAFGALLDAQAGRNFIPSIMYCGSMMFGSFLFFVALRFQVERKLFTRV
ncbi:major facilitator superfamily domain-containing protein [Cladochytrium replicatum]|nr:major facilitator superfamily domain-containing protein [Cladochytrium replicatum]